MVSYEHKVKNIYLGEPGWTPGENTLFYLPLDNDFNDYSYNQHQMSYDNGVSIVTDTSGKKVCSVNGGTIFQPTTQPLYTLTTYTVSIYLKSNYTARFAYLAVNGGVPVFGHDIISYRTKGGVVGSGGNNVLEAYNTSDIADNQRHNIIITYENGVFKGYVDGILTATANSSLSFTGNISFLGNSGQARGGIWNSYTGYASEIILESKARTAQEVVDYFNGTKSKYGIS